MLQTITRRRPIRKSADSLPDLAQRLADIHPALRHRQSKRARRVALRLDTKNRVMNLVIPAHMNLRKAEDFARRHEKWIQQRLADLPAPIRFVDGTVIPLLGGDKIIKITYSNTLKKTDISLKNNILSISTNKEDPTTRILRFLKNEAHATLDNLAREKGAIIGKTIDNVTVRDTKSRWGSCSSDGNISFSWRLIFAPWEAMDYVVAHEVAHLVHMNHSKAFWTQCAALCEDYNTGKKWMREHGNTLMRYG